jgi:hypothetical protein
MDRYGLRYKDAAHRLFFTELAKIQALDDAMRAAADAVDAIQLDMIKVLHPQNTPGGSSVC